MGFLPYGAPQVYQPVEPISGGIQVKVWGQRALFTDPANTAERYSYPIPTPSAAVGCIASIFAKPEIRWWVYAIEVLEPISYGVEQRREQKDLQTIDRVIRARSLDVPQSETALRTTAFLKQVAYVFHAKAFVNAGVDEDPAKYYDQLRRRASRGQCYRRPYLGTRECAAEFALPTNADQPIPVSGDIGYMVHYISTTPDGRRLPRFYYASMRDGIIDVPPPGSDYFDQPVAGRERA